MAEYTLPPELDAFAEAVGDEALGPFQAADFDADPSAAFNDGMDAAMNFMADADVPSDMMDAIKDIAQGSFEQHMTMNPDSDPMEAFDAVGGAVDMYLADFPGDMPIMDMMDAGMPPMPEDMGEFMDSCPPYGDFEGGESFDAAAMPDTWEPGPMTDMPPVGDDAPIPGEADYTGPEGEPGPMAEGDMPPVGDDAPIPGEADYTGPEGEPGPMAEGDMPPVGDDAPIPGEADYTGPEGEPGPMAAGDMPPVGDDAPIPGEADYIAPEGSPDPLFGSEGPAGGPPPGDMPPHDPTLGGAMPDGPMDPPDDMAGMQSQMDDAAATQTPDGPPPGDVGGPLPDDMPADMPPPSDDPNEGGDGMA